MNHLWLDAARCERSFQQAIEMVVGIFLGEYNGSPVLLRNEVHLTPHYALRHADVSGAIGEQELRARVAAVEAAAYGSSVCASTGTSTIFVAVASDLSGARLDGVIRGLPIKLDATRTSVTGGYAGPRALFSVTRLFAAVLLLAVGHQRGLQLGH